MPELQVLCIFCEQAGPGSFHPGDSARKDHRRREMTQLFFSVLGALRGGGGGGRWWCREDEQVFWRLNLGKMGLETLRLEKMKLLKGYQCI